MSKGLWYPVFIGIGSNLDDPVSQVVQALAELTGLEQSALVVSSALYYSDPLVPEGQSPDRQNDYVNAVAGLLTRCAPLELLDQLQSIEHTHGRDRSAGRWSSRTLDLDILAYADRQIDSDRLTVPHPELRNRSFVLGPWVSIAPQFKVVGMGHVDELARSVDLGTLRRIETPMGKLTS